MNDIQDVKHHGSLLPIACPRCYHALDYHVLWAPDGAVFDDYVVTGCRHIADVTNVTKTCGCQWPDNDLGENDR